MSFAATAVSVGAAAAGSIASGAMASSAAGQSANDIRGQADYNSKVTWQQLQQNDQAFAPWVSGGRTAQGLVSYGLGMGGVTDADLTKAQQEYQAALAAFEAGQRQQVKKKYRSRWLAQQEQLKKNLDDAGRRLADIQRAAEVQKSGGVRPGEFSENLWRDFTLADITNDPGYQYLKSRGLVGEGDWKTDPLYRELVSRGILAEGDWKTDPLYRELVSRGLVGEGDWKTDPLYRELVSRGLVGEGDWKTDPLYRELVSRGILAEGDWRNDSLLAQLNRELENSGIVNLSGGIESDPRMKWLADRGLISLNGTWQTDPGYLFRLGEGQKVLENSAAARGGLLSGQTGKALQQYGQNFASNEFSNVYNRYNTLWDDYANRKASALNLKAGALQDAFNRQSGLLSNLYSDIYNRQAGALKDAYNRQAGALKDAYNRQVGLLSNLYSDIYNRNKGLSDDAYRRHVADYTARAGEREAKFGKLTGQSGQGLQTLGQLAQLAFQGQQANNAGAFNAANLAGNYNVMGANAMASGLSSALNSIGSLAMYAGGGGFGGSFSGGGGSGGASNTSTFANNLAKNTAFQNFMPTNYWG
jgi:hypothetical protein